MKYLIAWVYFIPLSLMGSDTDTLSQEFYFHFERNSISISTGMVASSYTVGYQKQFKPYIGYSIQAHYLSKNELFFDLPDEFGNPLSDYPIDARSFQVRLGLDLYAVDSRSFSWKFILGPTLGYLRFPLWQGTRTTFTGPDGSQYLGNINFRDDGFDGVVFGFELETQLLYKVQNWSMGPTISLAGSTRESGFQSYGFYVGYRL